MLVFQSPKDRLYNGGEGAEVSIGLANWPVRLVSPRMHQPFFFTVANNSRQQKKYFPLIVRSFDTKPTLKPAYLVQTDSRLHHPPSKGL